MGMVAHKPKIWHGAAEGNLTICACGQVMAWTLGAIVLGAVLYPLLQRARRDGWCDFMGTSPHDFSDALKGKFMPYSGAPSRTTSGEIAPLTAAERGMINQMNGNGSPDRPSTASSS